MENTKGTIEFKNVNFSYRKGKQVLFDFNLDVRAGHKVALVGATGSGKTTVVNLLMRFYDIDSGEILIDGVNIKDISIEELRKNTAIVLQDTVLFSDTIRNNLKYSNLDASDDEMIEATKLGNCYNMIKHFPEKFDTMLTEAGQNLSQGQRQLLSIARAFLADPKILILDEATSALDNESQEYIKKTIDELVSDHTVIIVAHRLSTIVDADRIYVIDKGVLAGSGTHKALLEKNEVYRSLYFTENANSSE